MSPLFRRKREEGKTVLILDVENGSVGAALARIEPMNAPKLFGETRISTPILKTHNSTALMGEIEKAAAEALHHTAGVAARIRNHPTHYATGEVSHAAIFLSAPWAALDVAGSSVPHPITQRIYDAIGPSLGYQTPVSYHPFSTAAVHMIPSLFPYEERYLLCMLSGEVMELVMLERDQYEQHILGTATLPLGRNALVRTLGAHGGLSEAEVYSFLKLPHTSAYHPLHEPLHALAAHVASEFKSVAQDFLPLSPIRSVFIVGHEPMGQWFARSLAEHPSMADLFPEGGTVRAVRGSHITPFISVHAKNPDLPLLIEAVFVDARFIK